jgi:integrase
VKFNAFLTKPLGSDYYGTSYLKQMHSLNELWAAFLAERSISLSPTSLTTDYAQVTKWLSRCPIQDPTQGRQIIIWILGQQPTKSARRVCMFTRSMYKWAAAEDVALLERNPVANFRMPKAPQKDHEITVITKPEMSLIMIALKSKQHHRGVDWSLYAEFMLQTGMRTGEVRALKWSDIDGDRVLVHSNYTLTHGYKNSTKTNKKRWVPLNDTAKEILEALSRESDYLFPWNRYAFQSFFRDRVDQLFEAELVKSRYRPYDLRHVAISRWLEAGIPVTQAAQWAGNTSEVIWKHYAATTTSYEMPNL